MNPVVEWYAGRSVFITGGTGFMGKILLVKLLRALPGLKNVYVLVRARKGLAPQERLNAITKLPIFAKLREFDATVFEKLVAVEGDITQDNLALSNEDIETLAGSVSVVFHGAATLRLESTIKDAVIQNTLGTQKILDLCLQFRKLQAVIHMSTAFCHCDVETLEERIYPPTRDPNEIINLIKWLDESSLESIKDSILGPHPNSYTFSKRLAETIAYDMGDKLPIVIARPSIVIPSLLEPIPGWVDTLNGPVGLLVAAGKGVIRSMLVEAGNHAEFVPVDIAINGLITTAWYRSTRSFKETPVYNMTQSDITQITWGEVLEKGRTMIYDNPFEWTIWYPDGNIRTNKMIHNLMVLLLHILPAYFIDFLLLIFGQKRFMVRLQKRITLGLELLQYFTLREWKYTNNKVLQIGKEMTQEDLKLFYMSNVEYDVDMYLMTCLLGCRKFLLKEDLSTIPRARRNMKILYLIDRGLRIFVFAGLVYFLIHLTKINYLLSTYMYKSGGGLALQGMSIS